MFLLMLLAQLLAWDVSDTTDNNTGTRSVIALQLSENEPYGGEDATLSFHCVDGRFQLWLNWSSGTVPEYATVSFEQGIASDSRTLRLPTTWRRLGPESTGILIAPDGEAAPLIAAIREGPAFRVRLHDQLIGREAAIFLSENIQAAHRRLVSYCNSAEQSAG